MVSVNPLLALCNIKTPGPGLVVVDAGLFQIPHDINHNTSVTICAISHSETL